MPGRDAWTFHLLATLELDSVMAMGCHAARTTFRDMRMYLFEGVAHVILHVR